MVRAALSVSWRKLVLLANLGLIGALIVWRYIPSIDWHLDRFFFGFNLSVEMNFAVWWSSTLLLLCSLLLYEFFSRRQAGLGAPWLLLSVIFVTFSWDEIGSLHERNLSIDSSAGVMAMLVIGALLGSAALYAVYALLRRSETRTTGWLIGLAFFLFATVPVQEVVEHRVDWPYWLKGIRAGVEEGTELVAVFIVLCALAIQRRPARDVSLRQILPDPASLRGLRPALLMLLVLHSAVSLLYLPSLGDLDTRGNPGAWYPAAVYFLLFCHALRKATDAPGQTRTSWWGGLALFLLICSVVIDVRLDAWWPGMILTRWLPTDFGVIYAYQFALMGAFLAGLNQLDRRALPMYVAAGLLPLFLLPSGNPGAIYLVLGLSAYLYAEMLYRTNKVEQPAGAPLKRAGKRPAGYRA